MSAPGADRPFSPLAAEREWREAGLPGRFVAVPVPGDERSVALGLVTASNSPGTVEAARRLDVRAPLRPAVVQLGGLATSVSGPRRAALGRALTTGRAANEGVDPLRTLAERVAARCPAPTARLDLRVGDDPVHAERDGTLLVLHGPEHDRWDVVDALLGCGAEVVATATAAQGDRGGVVWARHPARVRSVP